MLFRSLVAKLQSNVPGAVRPCTRCNQTCQVRDARNPIITCVVEPSTGHETDDPQWEKPTSHARRVLVLGGGPAGLEAARVSRARGHSVRLVERSEHLGGLARVAGPAAPFVDWLVAECTRLGVSIETNGSAEPSGDEIVVECTGSVSGTQIGRAHV